MFWFFRLSLVALGADFAWKHKVSGDVGSVLR